MFITQVCNTYSNIILLLCNQSVHVGGQTHPVGQALKSDSQLVAQRVHSTHHRWEEASLLASTGLSSMFALEDKKCDVVICSYICL